jgi:hypothetical protein
MAGLDPAIHVVEAIGGGIYGSTWMPGSSPGMTALVSVPG